MRYVVGLALLLGACAPTVDGTELGGVATWTGRPAPTEAVAAANTHCQRYGRTARVTQVDALGYLAFSCERS